MLLLVSLSPRMSSMGAGDGGLLPLAPNNSRPWLDFERQ